MKASLFDFSAAIVAAFFPLTAVADINSGSDGHDGALNPTSDLVIDMANHPDGIYHYTSVNIPVGVTVSFIPNAGNKPVVWLVQGSCTITGVVSLNGGAIDGSTGSAGKKGGPGGFAGGNAPPSGGDAGSGVGPGGGKVTAGQENFVGGNGSFATVGEWVQGSQHPPGDVYGSPFLVPLVGGSGGSGGKWTSYRNGGAGGGGALLIAASGTITINGSISASGGGVGTSDSIYELGGGGASGGSIRLVATTLAGNGGLSVSGGKAGTYSNSGLSPQPRAGAGRIRIDAMADNFVGSVSGSVSRGFQPIILPPANQTVSLAIQSVAGIAVVANPTGQLTTPDVIIPANQQSPVPIVVRCVNIPLNTEILVDVTPANGAVVRGVALNTAGTQASSTATIQVNMPRGGGTIQAKAVSGIQFAAANNVNDKIRSLAATGWTADGERFSKIEVTATLGGAAQIAYVTESGKRYAPPTR